MPHHRNLRPDITTSPIKQSAKRAFTMAGLKPGDMDLVSLYDCYTIRYWFPRGCRFCAKGEGEPFVEQTSPQGRTPRNTYGASCPGVSRAWLRYVHANEAVRQLRASAATVRFGTLAGSW